MLLTLTSTTRPARDLGLLLRKHPDRVQSFELSVGSGRVFYPEAVDDRCTAALLLDVDPVGLVRGRPSSSEDGLVDAYVNDRPYAVSSFVSVAIARIFGAALGGRSEPPELAVRDMQLEAVMIPVAKAEDDLPARLFEPLGYVVKASDVDVPATARAGAYQRISVSAKITVRELLAHLYVLIPVMDAQKHYWVGDAEVDKLFRHGANWLPSHPERELITKRYLKRAPGLARAALARLAALDEGGGGAAATTRADVDESALERPLRLQDRRIETVAAVLREGAVKSVVDLGCGEGDLIAALARDLGIDRLVGVDVSVRELTRARERLSHVTMSSSRRDRIELFQSSLLYTDRRLQGFDAAAVLEVIEHIEPERLATLERIVFGVIRPRLVVLTTPNSEYNALFPTLAPGRLRHPDHRFEWTRAQFTDRVSGVAVRFGYAVSFAAVGEPDPTFGPPTQMAVFRCN